MRRQWGGLTSMRRSYLNFYFGPVFAKAESFGFLKVRLRRWCVAAHTAQALVETQKLSLDALTPDNSLNMYLLSDLAMDLINVMVRRQLPPGWRSPARRPPSPAGSSCRSPPTRHCRRASTPGRRSPSQ